MFDRLTPKELAVTELVAQAMTNKEIAKQLGTTEQTIKNYMRHIFDKTGTWNRLELALVYIARIKKEPSVEPAVTTSL